MNYIVRIKNVKVDRLKTLLKYLNNENHKNHTKKSTEIYELSNREDFVKISSKKIVKNKEEYVKNKKGGRPLKVLGKSLTFNIPPSFDFDLEKSKLIYEDLINGLVEIYQNLSNDKYDIDVNEIYGVLHKQENPHYHILIPYLTRNGETIRDIKPKAFNSELKLLWNKVMEKHYGVSIKDYEPLSREEQNKSDNRRYLEEVKATYEERLKISEDKYLRNQMKVIDRLLKENDSDIDNSIDKIDTIENNLRKAKGFYKSLKSVQRPTM